MRIVDLFISEARADALCAAADEHGHRWTRAPFGDGRTWVRVLVEQGDPDELLESLRAELREDFEVAGDDGPRGEAGEYYAVVEGLVIEPHRDDDDEAEAEAGSDEIESFVADGARISRSFVVLSALAGVLAAGGLMLDNPAVLVGAMTLAPLFKPMGLAGVATLLGKPWRALRGLAGAALSLLIAASIGALVTLLTPDASITAAIEARTGVRAFDVAIALAAGVAMAYALLKRDAMVMVGIVVAASLVPVAGALGVAVAMLRPELILGAAFTLASNICGILLGLVAALRLHQLHGLTNAERRKGEVWGRRSLIGGSVAVVALIVLGVWSYTEGSARRDDATTLPKSALTQLSLPDGARLMVRPAPGASADNTRGAIPVEWYLVQSGTGAQTEIAPTRGPSRDTGGP